MNDTFFLNELLSVVISLYLNSVIFIDIYLTMTNPFKPRENRVKIYYIGVILLCIGLTIMYNLLGKTGPYGI